MIAPPSLCRILAVPEPPCKSSSCLLVFRVVRRGESVCAQAVPPSLEGEECGHEDQGCGNAEPQCETGLVADEEVAREQSDASAGDDAVDEGDHACGGGDESDQRSEPLWR